MAIFRLQITAIGRNHGRRATAAAAYRAGERIRDERSGELHNFSHRKDVLHTEILLPAHLSDADVHWARDRSRLWNAAEQAETRRTARVAREFQVNLPAELSAEQRLKLARTFSQELSDRYSVAVDLAIHEPRSGGDPRNFHAHLLATTREVTAGGLGAKAGIDMQPAERSRRGLLNISQEFLAIRERWAALTNEALREAHIDARVDHRSLKAQGIDREPRPSIPLPALRMEQAGMRSEVADRLREQYNTRVKERLETADAHKIAAATSATPPAMSHPVQPTQPVQPKTLEEIRREAREAWLRLRGDQAPKTGVSVQQEQVGRELNDDYSP